jgi:hypothetical protein
MWVTQTYLGAVEPDARVFVYYFFEDYDREQLSFTEQVQRELEKLGEVFGDKVSLLMPNPRYAGRIEAEVRENMQLWTSIRGELPGLFVSMKPLIKLDKERGSCVYIPFKNQDPQGVAEVIQEVRKLAADTLSWEHAIRQRPIRKSLAGRLWDAIELKPGICGIKIDLRRLTDR